MKVYLLELEFYYKNKDDNDRKVEVYSSLERAVEEGKYFFEEEKKWEDEGICELKDYDFCVTEIDLEYAENFTRSKMWTTEDYLKRKPTHITYKFDSNRNVEKKIS